ncbi:MAG: cobalt-precorrin-5B (C(1))-methyltransferase CbiD [Syntrophobacteraceae bacterium]|nr:cobalt-precorrin-5B (C(1))-methyltransferase CbiD [Syntrophobacteraceae bacterium]
MPVNTPQCDGGKSTQSPPGLRSGFSSGTAATAAAVAALRCLISGASADTIAVRLPSGVYLAVPVARCTVHDGTAWASVIKDGGDDPDVTNGAEIRAGVTLWGHPDSKPAQELKRREIVLLAGRGIGTVTKPGLPALPGEPAINPVPRQMLAENITLELLRSVKSEFEEALRKTSSPGQRRQAQGGISGEVEAAAGKSALRLPLHEAANDSRVFDPPHDFSIMVEIEAPKGEELARRTLNPRLGIIGGISILGTTGLVRPFSHEAYEQTIQAALSVAASNRCDTAVLSTGGKSERFARQRFPELPSEAFVQIADFFSFAVRESVRLGFAGIIHSIFFGKAVKMAMGHPYTHAHSAPMDLEFLALLARSLGHDDELCAKLAVANTARHALDIIADRGSRDIIESVARKAAEQSASLAGGASRIRLLLFDYDGKLLAEAKAAGSEERGEGSGKNRVPDLSKRHEELP